VNTLGPDGAIIDTFSGTVAPSTATNSQAGYEERIKDRIEKRTRVPRVWVQAMTKPSKPSMERAREIVYGPPRWTDDATLVERIAKALDDATEELSERCCELHVMNNLWQEGRAHSAKLVVALESIAAPAPDSEIPSFDDEDVFEKLMTLNFKRRTIASEALKETP